MTVVAPYGSWKSPITTDLIVSGAVGLGQIAIDGDDVYWVEMRPSEGGRMVIVRRSGDGGIGDVTPEPYSVRTRVHEYGGAAFLVVNGVVFFSNFTDQRMYRQDPGDEPRAITPEAPLRYADGALDGQRERIVCVREDHSADGEPVNAIIAVDASGANPQITLYAGSDFCAAPRLSPEGSALAWLSWNHPGGLCQHLLELSPGSLLVDVFPHHLQPVLFHLGLHRFELSLDGLLILGGSSGIESDPLGFLVLVRLHFNTSLYLRWDCHRRL